MVLENPTGIGTMPRTILIGVEGGGLESLGYHRRLITINSAPSYGQSEKHSEYHGPVWHISGRDGRREKNG